MVSERQLKRSGVPVEGEVIKVERTAITMNRVHQWVIRYRYKDHMGQAREGKTGMLPPDQARAWNKGTGEKFVSISIGPRKACGLASKECTNTG